MSESNPPKSEVEVVGTLTEIFRCQGRNDIVELLERAQVSFDETYYDNWNGGTYTWALRIEIPVSIFAALESQLVTIEKDIGDKLAYLEKRFPNDRFGEVTITPLSPEVVLNSQGISDLTIKSRRLWPEGRFRLFLSHLASDKVTVSQLKGELALLGVAAFVAHEDIEPTREWCDEIELALCSMQALAALITPGFHGSNWTDQEIGWALGRGLLVLPVRLGMDPYGFAGKYQGISGKLENSKELAVFIVKALLANSLTHREMRNSLIIAFIQSDSYKMSTSIWRILRTITDFSTEEKEKIWNACIENNQVTGTYSVVSSVYATIGRPPTLENSDVNDDVPF